MYCIVCNKELKSHEKEECSSCKKMLDEKYRGDSEGRELSKRYFKWLKSQEDKKNEEN